jgi:hypothetical protein
MVGVRPLSLDKLESNGKPVEIDSCYAYGASRDLVKTLWPDHHQPAQAVKTD